MDSGLKDLPSGAPSTTPSSSWIPKELTNSSFTGTGFSLAQITAEYMYNTLANLMFTNGNSAELTDDGIITGKWSPEVVQFNF